MLSKMAIFLLSLLCTLPRSTVQTQEGGTVLWGSTGTANGRLRNGGLLPSGFSYLAWASQEGAGRSLLQVEKVEWRPAEPGE